MCSPATASDGLPPLSVAERESKKAGNSMGNTTDNVTPQGHGAPHHPSWFHNLMAQPWTTVQVGTEVIEVTA